MNSCEACGIDWDVVGPVQGDYARHAKRSVTHSSTVSKSLRLDFISRNLQTKRNWTNG